MAERLAIGESWDRRLKRKIDEPSITNKDSNLLLSLSLSGSNTLQESSSNMMPHADSNFDPKLVENSNNKGVIKPKEHEFSCKFCNKKFLNFQALGGHQNAHRRERILSKMNKEIAMGTFGFSAYPCPCSSMENIHPFHGSSCYHAAHMNPMAQMSPMPWHHSGHGYGNQGLHNTPFSGHQFGITSNLSTSVQTPQNLNQSDVGFGCEPYQASSLKDVVNKSTTTQNDLEGHPKNHYTRN
ncbi:unnamed protein product [Lupinus luteus]|uniref:C2H2-type domain-containing protein n=1 Tax=Lupinus luteus TaxID=3873 RepID=A0AAV1YE14_LUPLU